MKKNKFIACLLLVGLGVSLAAPLPSRAQTEDNKTIENIKKVIQDKKVELSSGAANLRSNQAYLAEVLRVNEGALTIQTPEGQQVIPLESVTIEQKGKTIEIGQLSIGAWVGVFKNLSNPGEPRIDKIVAYERDFRPPHRRIIIGSIQSIGRSDLSILPRGSAEALQFSLGRNSSLQDNRGETVKLSQFYEELHCLIVATEDDNGNYVISTMRALSALD